MKKAQAGRKTEEAFQRITGLTSGAYSETKAECYNMCAEHC